MVATIIQVYKRHYVKVGGARLAKMSDLPREKGVN